MDDNRYNQAFDGSPTQKEGPPSLDGTVTQLHRTPVGKNGCLNEALRQTGAHLAALSTQLHRSTDNLLNWVSKDLIPAIVALQWIAAVPPQVRQCLLLLGHQGWYLDWGATPRSMMTMIVEIAAGNHAEANRRLCAHFESRLSGIEQSIAFRYPSRAGVIGAAFRAHRCGEYHLSIPVFFAQTDGICHDEMKQYFFQKRAGKPRTAMYVEEIAADAFLAALLSPLSETLPVNASESGRNAQGMNDSVLNRHSVMHGESLDYGNRTNSFKAVSLLNFVAHAARIPKPAC